jgi:acyl-coenzyme A thioesterase PaaI-like protein
MELLAVTVSLNVQFLRKPRQADLIAEATVLKHGRRLIVGQVLLYSDGEAEPVAHVTGSYAVP